MPLYATKDFRSFIIKNDLESAKKSLEIGGSYSVTCSEINKAASSGSIDCLNWLLTLNIPINDYDVIADAIIFGKSDAFIILLKKGIKITSRTLNCIFNSYQHEIEEKQLTENMINNYKSFNININTNNKINTKIRLISALCKRFNMKIQYEHLFYLSLRLLDKWLENQIEPTLSDIKFLFDNHKEDLSDFSNEYVIELCSLQILLNVHILEIKTVNLDIIKKCLHTCSSYYRLKNYQHPDILRQNFILALEKYSVEINYHFSLSNCFNTQSLNEIITNRFVPLSYLSNVFTFSVLFEYVPFSIEYLEAWLVKTIYSSPIEICEKFTLWISEKQMWSKFICLELIIMTTLFHQPSLFDTIIEQSIWDKTISIINCVKLFGLPSNRMKNEFENLKYKHIIDFSEAKESDYEEQWVWIGIGKTSTYEKYPYNVHPIHEQFKNIKTIQNVQDNITELDQIISSPTACYFNFQENDVFYRDQQDCVIWACDNQGCVYIKNDYQPYLKQYVAHSIPEFLSHIYDDNLQWYNKKIFY